MRERKTNNKKKLIIAIVLLFCMYSLAVPIHGLEPMDADDTHVYVVPEKTHIEIGGAAGYNYTYVAFWCNTTQTIDTWQVQWINYTQGVVNCTGWNRLYNATAEQWHLGTFITDHDLYDYDRGTIHNDLGYIGSDLTYESSTVDQNNTNGTLCNLTFEAVGVGEASFFLAKKATQPYIFGVDGACNRAHTFHYYNITVHPENAQSFNIAAYNRTQINITWTKGIGADNTTIVAKEGSVPGSMSDGAIVYNGTGSNYEHSGLEPGSTWGYKVWSWNSTESLHSYMAKADVPNTATTDSNTAPTVTTETPTNATSNIVLSPSGSIVIEDADGDTIQYSMNLSNGDDGWQKTSGSGTDGTYSWTNAMKANVSTYDKTYYWNVTLYDGYNWSNYSYWFTTQSDMSPTINLILIQSIDYNGASFNIYADQGDANVSLEVSESEDMDASTTYWDNESSDGGIYGYRYQFQESPLSNDFTANATVYYRFTVYNGTSSENNTNLSCNVSLWTPWVGETTPAPDATEQESSVWLNGTVNITDGGEFTGSIYEGTYQFDPEMSVFRTYGGHNKTISYQWTGLEYNTEYAWGVALETNNSVEKIVDGVTINESTRSNVWMNEEWGNPPHDWNFTTRLANTPSIPTDFVATQINGTVINLTWTKGTNATATMIRASQTTYPTTRSEGSGIFNQTYAYYDNWGLSECQHWYYSAFSYNETDNNWTSSYATADAWTNSMANLTPIMGNGTGNQDLSLTYQVTVDDRDGDTIALNISCNNSQSQQWGAAAANATYGLALSGLSPSTTYTVYVNATDAGTLMTTYAWYTFTTESEVAPTVTNTYFPNGTYVETQAPTLNITVTDADADTMNITINITTPDATGLTSSTWTDVTNNTFSVSTAAIKNKMASFGKQYNWTVKATDGTHWTNKTYYFYMALNKTLYNASGSGYNYVAIFNSTNATNLANAAGNSSAVQQLFIWNATTQSWSNSYFPGTSVPEGADEINLTVGDHIVINVNDTTYLRLIGFNPKSSNTLWYNAGFGLNWLGRTDDTEQNGSGTDLCAGDIPGALVTSANCTQILYYDASTQSFPKAYFPGISGSADNFTISEGMAICIDVSANETLTQYGW